MKNPETYAPSKRVQLIASGASLIAAASSMYFTFTTAKEHSQLRSLERNVVVVTDTEYYVTTLGTAEQLDAAHEDFKRSGFAAGASIGAALIARSILGVQDERSRRQRNASSDRKLEEHAMTMKMLDCTSRAIMDCRGYSPEGSAELHHWDGSWYEDVQSGLPLGSQHQLASDILYPSA